MRDELSAIGKLKEGIPGEPCEDDLMLSTRVESISSIKFFNQLKLGDAWRCLEIQLSPVELSLLKC